MTFGSAGALARWWRPSKRIFISYRREDTADVAERLHRRLAQQFGASSVFFDRADIQHGQPWREEVAREVDAADVVIALIGSRWLDSLLGRTGDDDVLRFELATALAHSKQIIPVLVAPTTMPDVAHLPDLRGLAEIQALSLSSNNLDQAVRELLGRLKPGVGLAVAWAISNVLGLVAGLLILVLGIYTAGALESASETGGASTRVILGFAVSGALLGLCIGVPQWVVLRAWFDVRHLVPAYTLVCAIGIGFAASSAWSDAARGLGASLVMILVLPILLGLILWWLLRTQLVHAGWWSTANIVAPFAGLMIAGGTPTMADPVQETANIARFVFLVPAFLPALLCGFLLIWLMRRSQVTRR